MGGITEDVNISKGWRENTTNKKEQADANSTDH